MINDEENQNKKGKCIISGDGAWISDRPVWCFDHKRSIYVVSQQILYRYSWNGRKVSYPAPTCIYHICCCRQFDRGCGDRPDENKIWKGAPLSAGIGAAVSSGLHLDLRRPVGK